jgi:hypothetical protein
MRERALPGSHDLVEQEGGLVQTAALRHLAEQAQVT